MDRIMTRTARFLAVGGVAAIVFGVILLFWPGISLVALTALFGAFALVYGMFALGSGLTLLAHRSTEWVPFVVGGIAGVLIAAITFLHPGVTVLALTYLIAAWAFVIGVLEVVGAIDMWGEIDGAVWLAIGGVLSIAFGVIVAFQPGTGLLAIIWMIGLFAILSGVTRLVAAYKIHQAQTSFKKAVTPTPTTSTGGELRTHGA